MPPVFPPVEIPSPSERSCLRGSTWLSVQVRRLYRRACKTSRHRTECATGADPLAVNTAVAGCARTQLVDPATGPLTPTRSQNARSNNDCVRVVTSRVTHRSSRLTFEWPEDHPRIRRSDRGAAPSGPPLVRAAPKMQTRPAPPQHRIAHVVSFRITCRRSLPAVVRSEDRLPASRSSRPAVTVEPPCEQRSSDRPGPSRSNAKTTRVVSSRITPPTLLSHPPMARGPPLDKRFLPTERHRRAAL